MDQVKYDEQKRSRAYKAVVLRMAVALYICCIAFKISSAEDTSMSKTWCWIIGGIFMAVAIAFVVYSRKRFLSDLDEAKIKDDNSVDDEAEGAEAVEEEDSAESDTSGSETV